MDRLLENNGGRSRLQMCNIAQMVNVLHSLLLTEGEKSVRTPTYYAFDLMKEHRTKTAVRIESKDTSPLGPSFSASKKGPELVLSCVNPKHDVTLSLDCALSGSKVSSGKARILHHPDFNACNSFDKPDAVVAREHSLRLEGSHVRMDLPPLSVVTAILQLG